MISKFRMGWGNVFDDSRNGKLEKEVLDELKPHSDNLKDLSIKSYGGKLFPNWVGDPSFLTLTSVRIERCENCTNLPPLGELPSLKMLKIQALNKVEVVGSEFLGRGIAFPKLESLRIAQMAEWKVWSTKSGVVGAVIFPCLQELYLEDCLNLVEVSLEALPSLRELYLRGCGDAVLTSLIHAASSVTKLSISRISGLGDEVWRGVMNYLGSVEDLRTNECDEIRYLWESEAEASKVLVNLRKLEVGNCSKLVSLGEKEEDGCNQLTCLRILKLSWCENFERFNLPNSIEKLSIGSCPLIASVSFPTGEGHKLKSLEIYNCEQLLEKDVLLNTSMPLMLESVDIYGWKNLKSINELTCFIQLTKLTIKGCSSIESMIELTSFIHLTELTIKDCSSIESVVELACLVHLTKLSIEDCSSIESFPAADLPSLTSLKSLTILNCKSMDVDSFGLWPPNLGLLRIGGLKKPISKLGCLQIGCLKKPISELAPENFPSSLVELFLCGGSSEEDDVTSGSQLSHMLPSSLTKLWLRDFEKLETISKGLQHLTSLQHLQIRGSPKMKGLPEELLPSLLSLKIMGCTDELKKKTSRRGSYWPLISYIPYVHIC